MNSQSEENYFLFFRVFCDSLKNFWNKIFFQVSTIKIGYMPKLYNFNYSFFHKIIEERME
jgi:hypothetical protein